MSIERLSISFTLYITVLTSFPSLFTVHYSAVYLYFYILISIHVPTLPFVGRIKDCCLYPSYDIFELFLGLKIDLDQDQKLIKPSMRHSQATHQISSKSMCNFLSCCMMVEVVVIFPAAPEGSICLVQVSLAVSKSHTCSCVLPSWKHCFQCKTRKNHHDCSETGQKTTQPVPTVVPQRFSISLFAFNLSSMRPNCCLASHVTYSTKTLFLYLCIYSCSNWASEPQREFSSTGTRVNIMCKGFIWIHLNSALSRNHKELSECIRSQPCDQHISQSKVTAVRNAS